MTQPAKTQEPSMEEILASIRRIIADDPVKTPRHETARGQAVRTEKAQTNDGLYRDRAPVSARREDLPRPLPPRDDGSQTFPPPFTPARAEETLYPSPASGGGIRGGGLAGATAAPQPASSSSRAEQPSAAWAAQVNPQAEIDAMLAELNSRTRAAAREPEEPAADILELTEEMTAEETPAQVVLSDAEVLEDAEAPAATMPAVAVLNSDGEEQQGEELRQEEQLPEPTPDDVQSRSYAAEHETEPLHSPPRPIAVDEVDEGLISPATTAAVDSAFNTLAQTVLVQNARTLEDLVREMLRPMLKIWLDDNLPGLVERLVRAEIERVSRGRG